MAQTDIGVHQGEMGGGGEGPPQPGWGPWGSVGKRPHTPHTRHGHQARKGPRTRVPPLGEARDRSHSVSRSAFPPSPQRPRGQGCGEGCRVRVSPPGFEAEQEAVTRGLGRGGPEFLPCLPPPALRCCCHSRRHSLLHLLPFLFVSSPIVSFLRYTPLCPPTLVTSAGGDKNRPVSVGA